MNYEEAIEYIKNLPNCSFKRYGLTGIKGLLKRLNNPQKKLKFIHIAGTNGKGSVSTYCYFALKEAGFKTGLYISPYVIEFEERIQINGNFIKKEEVVVLVLRLKKIVEELNREGIFLTGFDFVTALSIEYFYENRCDVVVFEVGMGGRLDSTNVVDEKISIITHIDYDHVNELGGEEKSILNIAKEKAGILKNKGICICSYNQKKEVLDFLKKEAESKNVEFIVSKKPEKIKCNFFYNEFEFNKICFKTKLFGLYQIENAAISISALLRIGIDTESIKKGLYKAFIPARFEIIEKDPILIFDGAHNENGVLALKENVELFKDRFKVGVISVINTKDYLNMLRNLKGVFDILIITKMKDKRAISISVLEKAAKNLKLNYKIEKEPLKAIELAKNFALKDGVLVCFGSLYFISEIRKFFV